MRKEIQITHEESQIVYKLFSTYTAYTNVLSFLATKTTLDNTEIFDKKWDEAVLLCSSLEEAKRKIEKKEDVYFFNYVNEKHINGLFGFSMFDTYGFPIDLSKEIMEEKGFNLNENKFNLIMELSKNKSRNTKITKAFN